MGETQEPQEPPKDKRCDNRLTVIEVTLSKNRKDTVLECIATQPGKRANVKWFRVRLVGVHDVAFGWLVGFLDATHVRLHWHEDEPGQIANLRCAVAEFSPQV